jgi:hypothetical protein
MVVWLDVRGGSHYYLPYPEYRVPFFDQLAFTMTDLVSRIDSARGQVRALFRFE